MKNSLERIGLCEPYLQGKEWEYIKDCLDSGWVSSVGSYVDRFEASIAACVKSTHAVACVNGTSALHTALMVAGIEANDEVIIPALTFIAPASAVRYTGAYPVFMDVEKDFWQIDPLKLKDFLKTQCSYHNHKLINNRTKRQIKAIIPVHLLGHPCDMDAVMALAHEFGLTVIEDVAESIGAKYKNQNLGNIGHMGCFSFNGNKIITAGGGGMLVTNNAAYAKRARYLTTQAKDDEFEYIHHEIGFNYRLSNIQAALGVAQMEALPHYIDVKHRIQTTYEQGLAHIPGIQLPKQASWAQAFIWLYTVCIDQHRFGASNRELMEQLRNQGIQTRPLWRPLTQLKPFQQCDQYHVEVANQLYDQAISLPSSVSLTESQQQRVIEAIRKRHG